MFAFGLVDQTNMPCLIWHLEVLRAQSRMCPVGEGCQRGEQSVGDPMRLVRLILTRSSGMIELPAMHTWPPSP